MKQFLLDPDNKQMILYMKTQITKESIGLDKVQNVTANLEATVPPSVNDDYTKGYSIGSTWVDIVAQKVYFCFNNDIGEAVWREMTNVEAGSHYDSSAVDAHMANTSNPHGVTAEQLGLDGFNLVTTMDGNLTTIYTIPTFDNQVYLVEVSAAGKRVDVFGEVGGYTIKALFKNIGNTLTKVSDDTLNLKM